MGRKLEAESGTLAHLRSGAGGWFKKGAPCLRRGESLGGGALVEAEGAEPIHISDAPATSPASLPPPPPCRPVIPPYHTMQTNRPFGRTPPRSQCPSPPISFSPLNIRTTSRFGRPSLNTPSFHPHSRRHFQSAPPFHSAACLSRSDILLGSFSRSRFCNSIVFPRDPHSLACLLRDHPDRGLHSLISICTITRACSRA